MNYRGDISILTVEPFGLCRRFCIIGYGLFALFLIPLRVADAGDEVIIIGVESNDYYPHYQFINGGFQGYVRDLFDRFSKDSNLKIRLRTMPLKRLLKEVRTGTVHLKYPDNPKWNVEEKKSDFIHSKPIVSYIDGTLVLPGQQGQPVENVRTLGTLIGFTPWPYFDRIQSGRVSVYEGTSLTGLIKRTMRRGRDGIYANIDVANYQLKRLLNQPGALVFDPGLPHAVSYYATSTVHHPELIKAFDQWQISADSFKQQLEEKYMVGRAGVLGLQPPAQ